jgi:hypothetical protein
VDVLGTVITEQVDPDAVHAVSDAVHERRVVQRDLLGPVCSPRRTSPPPGRARPPRRRAAAACPDDPDPEARAASGPVEGRGGGVAGRGGARTGDVEQHRAPRPGARIPSRGPHPGRAAGRVRAVVARVDLRCRWMSQLSASWQISRRLRTSSWRKPSRTSSSTRTPAAPRSWCLQRTGRSASRFVTTGSEVPIRTVAGWSGSATA